MGCTDEPFIRQQQDLPVGLDIKTPWARLPAVSSDIHTTMA